MNRLNRRSTIVAVAIAAAFACSTGVTYSATSSQSAFKDKIIIGGVLDLEGQSRGLGIGMRDGIQAAFAEEKVQGRQTNNNDQP